MTRESFPVVNSEQGESHILNPEIADVVLHNPELAERWRETVKSIIEKDGSPVTVTSWHPIKEDRILAMTSIETEVYARKFTAVENYTVASIEMIDIAALTLSAYISSRNQS